MQWSGIVASKRPTTGPHRQGQALKQVQRADGGGVREQVQGLQMQMRVTECLSSLRDRKP
jgi:hypothetical protein